MMEGREKLRTYMKAAGDDSQRAGGRCFPESDLLEYHQGHADPDQRERIQSHLMGCGACRQTLLDAKEFFEPAREGEAIPGGAEADWRRFERRIRPASRVLVWLPLAACVALAIATAWSLERLRQSEQANRQLQVAMQSLEQRATMPRPNASIHDVFSTEFLQRSPGANEANPVEAVASAPVTLVLNAAGQARHSSYRMEISDQAGSVVWRTEGLQRDAHANYVITFPGAFLKDGAYRFRVWGKTEASEKRLADYLVSWKTRRTG